VTSADGTPIAYRQYGAGPGVVLVHGGAGSAQLFGKLAETLARDFSVYVVDRRGRGRSGPFGPSHTLARECEDLDALFRHTGARALFGLSAGAVIALYAASKLPCVDKLALYEPPIVAEGARPDFWAARFEAELDRGDLGGALVTVLRGTADVGSPLAYVPRFVLRRFFGFALRLEKPKPDWIPFRELLPTLREDIALVREAIPLLDDFAALPCDVLLLGGSRSALELRAGLDVLAARLPRARRVLLDGVGHTAALDDGKPALVATALRDFFAPHGRSIPTSA